MHINFHTHAPTLSPGLIELESVYFGQTKTPTSTMRSVGLHPWHLENIDFDAAKKWLQTQVNIPETYAIGESGLDKVCRTPWDMQLTAFKICVEQAESAKMPLIIHCVRAFSEIIALKKQWKPRQTWIFHGFDKNKSIAAMVLRAGCCLSFGAALFRKNSHAAESLQATPADQFLLETDDAGLSIDDIYIQVAKLRLLEIEDLETQVEKNFSRIFKL
jgi:TatD DNase family protein